MLIIAIDGVSPETFGRQRVGGDLQLVTDNLKALISEKRRQNSKTCAICLQFLVFDYNRFETKVATQFALALGVDELHFIKATTIPWLDTSKPKVGFNPLAGHMLPRCAWPFFSAVVHSNGDVVGCCKYRMAEKYLKPDQVRRLGSFLQDGFQNVYQGKQYQMARAMAASPRRAGHQPDHFCSGCGSLYANPAETEIMLSGGCRPTGSASTEQ
jgi:hypothetical protein